MDKKSIREQMEDTTLEFIKVHEKTLRDEIAMSLESPAIPMPKDPEGMRAVCEKLGIEVDFNNTLKAIELGLKYQAVMRYRYADMMLEERSNATRGAREEA